MPRSSRHKTQRSRKHGDGELEGDASSRDRRVKQEEKDSAARVSAKSSSSKDLVLTSNGGEKKRKDRGEGSVVVVVDDRWNGGAEDEQVGEKKPKGEVFEGVDSEKGKGKGSESKSRSSRRQDGLSEGGESAKPKIEKESSRRDSSGSQYKSSKEREKDSGKDVKERDRDYNKESKERDRDSGRDVKEKDRDHNMDAKEKEKDRDHSKDAKEKEKEKDHVKDVKEKDRDHSKCVKEKERDADMEQLEQEYHNLHDPELNLVGNLKRHKDEDALKGQAVKNQKALWDKALEVRFLLQKTFLNSNRLPQELVRSSLCNSDSEVAQAYSDLVSSSKQTISCMLELEEALLEQNPAIVQAAMENSQDSLEEESFLDELKRQKDEKWAKIYRIQCRIAPFRNRSIHRWHGRMHVTSGAAAIKNKLHAFNQDISIQVAGYI